MDSSLTEVPPEWVTKLPDDKAGSVDCWPPKSGEFFDWEHWTTHEAYHDPKQSDHAPDFSRARTKLDWSYHKNPAYTRQELQDAILNRVVQAVVSPPQTKRPWLIFTAGAMGVGKGYVLSTLHQSGLFPADNFLKIDPDMIKAEIPEMSGYLHADPATAATKVHRESTQMADVLFEHALMNLTSILVDGSLRDVDYYHSLFERIRSDYPDYRIVILHVTAKRDVIFDRASKRAERTGRAVPPELLGESLKQVPKSVEQLSPQTDVTFEISNEDGSPLRLVSATIKGTTTLDPTWEDFARTWEDKEEAKEPCVLKRKCKLLCKDMDSCWTNCKAHSCANALWSKAYPNSCARCTLTYDGQCGVCIHGKHLCACDECAKMCPIRQRLKQSCKTNKCFLTKGKGT